MWTTICYDFDEVSGTPKPYVRLNPPFLNGSGLGISLGRFFETEYYAKCNAAHVDAYMEAAMSCLCYDIKSILDEASAKKVQEYFDQLKAK